MFELALAVSVAFALTVLGLARSAVDRLAWLTFASAAWTAASIIDSAAWGAGTTAFSLSWLWLGLGLACIAIAVIAAAQLVRG